MLRFVVLLALTLSAAPLAAATLETKAREAILIDAQSGNVMFEKDSEVSMPPASMSKIMTMYLVFERLKDGRLSLDDNLPVSEKAWKMGGSKMFVEVGDEVKVEDLIRGVVVQSGNDACVVFAEALAGSEEAFADLMTEKALALGMTNSTFRNSTGWPHPEHRTTARDLSLLARQLINDFPEYYHYFSELEFTYNEIRQGNRNPLLYKKSLGADGLKTGHTEEAGYGLTASAVQDNRRLILVINGLGSQRDRSEESARILSWAFREFKSYSLFKAGEVVDRIPVWLGDESTVPLVLPEDFAVTLPRTARNSMEVTVVFDSPIPAPITAGQEVAQLRVSYKDGTPIEVPLQAGTDIGLLGPFGRIFASLKFMVLGSP